MSETFFYLTTTGRRTGKPHKIEIWFVEHDGCYFLCSGNGTGADWVKNILANPGVTYHLGTSIAHKPKQNHTGRGKILDQEANDTLRQEIRDLFLNKYSWGSGLFVQICPEP
ncbi:MAG: nitroreductase family deazaflavin-dependent oxidoreductase [Anaerolineae bacterium]|nr:nitroreductase family deazaflavin-dependent oxidoreductase [Anaerolineae bacterium]